MGLPGPSAVLTPPRSTGVVGDELSLFTLVWTLMMECAHALDERASYRVLHFFFPQIPEPLLEALSPASEVEPGVPISTFYL